MANRRKKKLSKSPVMIITGMHRSGTSLTAAFIQALGTYMGESLMPADSANAKGYFEDLDFLEFQRSLLQNCCDLTEGGWHDWGWTESEFLDRSRFKSYTLAARRLIQLHQHKNQIWGWKDPRTSLLLNFWYDLLPEAKFIFVYRFPWDVVDSIRRINQPIFNLHPEYSLKIWAFYNRHILDFYRNHRDSCLLFHVDAIEHQSEQLIQLIQNKLKIPIDADRQALNTVFEKKLLNKLSEDDTNVTQMLRQHPDCLTLLAELEHLADISSKPREDSLEPLVVSPSQVIVKALDKASVKASVIIPCFNQGEFLVGAIASAEESINVDYEIIIIDDGSTDPKTQRILVSLEASGYRIIRQQNQGLANARNRGISIAKGQYILPLDADNRIRPDYLCKAIDILEHSPQVGIVYGDLEYFGEQTGIRNVPDFNLDILLIENYIDACAVIRKTVWESCGGYDANIPDKLGYEDWDLWLSASEQGWQFHHIAEVLFDYYVRSHSMVSACKIPANRRRLIQYLCQKHDNLYTPKFKNVIIQKDYFLFAEQQHSTQLQSQLAIAQSPWLPSQSNDLPLVSVCIPTYNGEEFLGEALESILKQTYPNLEIIISDDASTDSTLEIANAFQKRLRQRFAGGISIISHTQYGLVRNWNFCITQSRGKYIKFLFQDDILESDCIAAMVGLAEQDRKIGMVFSPRTFLLDREIANHPTLKVIYESCKDAHKLWGDLQTVQDGKELLSDPNLLERPFNKIGEPSTVLIRKEIFDQIGLFDPQFRQLVDLDLWLRIMGHSKIGFINRVLSYFRLHLKQETLKNATAGISDMFDFYRKLSIDPSYGFLPTKIRNLTFCLYTAISEQRDPSFQLEQGKQVKLRRIRRECAENWLICTEPQSESILLQTQLALLKTQITLAPLTDSEIQFVARIQEGLAHSPQAVPMLLAALGYRRFDQLSLSLNQIPQWLLRHGMEILCQCPKYFQGVGEIDIYCRYLQNVTNYLYKQIFNSNQDLLAIAASFIQHADFTPLQLTETSFKGTLAERSEIIKYVLRKNQCDLEYQFVARSPSAKIRVGIMTEVFASTSETYVSLPLYEHLDRDRFEIVLYALKRSGQPIEQYCQSRSSSFQLLSGNLKDMVESIRADNLDILFICAEPLSSPTSYLTSHQLAKFQICYSSLPDMSQDSVISPLEIPPCLSFGLVYSPAKLQLSREIFGIAEDAIVFTSGADFSNITPEICHTWAKICAAVPKSIFLVYPFLRCPTKSSLIESFYDRISQVFGLYKIEQNRVMLFNTDEMIDRGDMIKLLEIADVYLDFYPCSDWVADVDALQAYLPIVTRRQTSVSIATLLRDLELNDFIVDSENAYIDAAICLGRSKELRDRQRDKLVLAMQKSPRFLDSIAQSKDIAFLLDRLFV